MDTRVDPVTRAVKVRAELQNADGRLRPGMLMSVALLVAERDALAVPESALVSQGDKRFVFRIDAENKAQRVEVKTGLVLPGRVEISTVLPKAIASSSRGPTRLFRASLWRSTGRPAARPAAPPPTARGANTILSEISVRRPVLATVLSLLLVAFGLLSFSGLLRELPNIDPPVVSISTTYPGAAADVVQSRITEIIEGSGRRYRRHRHDHLAVAGRRLGHHHRILAEPRYR